MTHAEIRLVEEGWHALVEQLGVAEATRFVMLLDRRTGEALQHLQHLWLTTPTTPSYSATLRIDQSANQLETR